MKRLVPWIVLSAFVFVGAGCGSNNGKVSLNDKGVLVDSKMMGDLVESGKGMKCVPAKPMPYVASMTTYYSRKRMRNDFTVAGSSKTSSVQHQIIDGTQIYSWDDAHKDQATKTSMEELQKLGGTTSTDTQPKDVKDESQYLCSNWSVDESFFALPAGVNFRDFKEVRCEPCNKMTNEALKAQCKKSIGC